MAKQDNRNDRSGSTTWGWRYVRISPPPKAPPAGTARAKRGPLLHPLNDRMPLVIEVKYRGGAEAWWEIRARGRVWRCPGYMAIEDALRPIIVGYGGQSVTHER